MDKDIRDLARLHGHTEELSDEAVGEIKRALSTDFIDIQLDASWKNPEVPTQAKQQ